MEFSGHSFRPGFWPTVATAAGLALLVSLGSWQTSKYLEKRTFERQRDQRSGASAIHVDELDDLDRSDVAYRPAILEGDFRRDTTLVFEHRFHEGHPGVWLARPFDLEKGGALVVNLGWVPRARVDATVESLALRDRPRWRAVLHRLPRVTADDEMRHRLDAGDEAVAGSVSDWDSVDLEAVHGDLRTRTPDQPVFASLTESPTPDRFPLASGSLAPDPFLTSGRHLGYALFWFATALALFGIWLAAGAGVLASRERGRPRGLEEPGDGETGTTGAED